LLKDGLVKANMEKLTFYALSAPEKLDRIGAYLSERLSRDVARHRYGYVCIAMEALDQLLMACHCQSINLFVESFLKMVRKLLEADKPNLQILGTNSVFKKIKGIVHPKIKVICFYIRTDLEKFNIASLAHQWIICSECVPSE
uniref:Uncharacterized protein n=1 Tax=Sinocyclocheilus rhinocerous TaxID=307959 RepID=A0A673M3A4_9TELE